MPIRPLAEMTWEEARDAQRKAWLALLPIGAVEAEAEAQAKCMLNPNFREAYEAFSEKREARFE